MPAPYRGLIDRDSIKCKHSSVKRKGVQESLWRLRLVMLFMSGWSLTMPVDTDPSGRTTVITFMASSYDTFPLADAS